MPSHLKRRWAEVRRAKSRAKRAKGEGQREKQTRRNTLIRRFRACYRRSDAARLGFMKEGLPSPHHPKISRKEIPLQDRHDSRSKAPGRQLSKASKYPCIIPPPRPILPSPLWMVGGAVGGGRYSTSAQTPQGLGKRSK